MRLIAARRQADLMERAPEAVLRMRVVVAERRGPPARRRADENEAQIVRELVGQAVHGRLVGWVERLRNPPSPSRTEMVGFADAQPTLHIKGSSRASRAS